jgi:hypothetical protein
MREAWKMFPEKDHQYINQILTVPLMADGGIYASA